MGFFSGLLSLGSDILGAVTGQPEIAAAGNVLGGVFGNEDSPAPGGFVPGQPSDPSGTFTQSGGTDQSGLFTGLGNAVGSIGNLAGQASPYAAAGLAYQGVKDTNALNRQLYEENLAFQQNSINQQEAFQSGMWQNAFSADSTAVQRRMADLRAAGINPILAAGQAAQSPAPMSGGAASGGGVPRLESPGVAGVGAFQSASQAEQLRSSSRLMDAEVARTVAETEKVKQDTLTSASSAGELDARRSLLSKQVDNYEWQINALKADIGLKGAQEKLTGYEAAAALRQNVAGMPEARVREIAARISELSAKARELNSQADLLGYKVPEAVREAELWSSSLGPVLKQLQASPGVDKLVGGSMVETARQLHDLGGAVDHSLSSAYRAYRRPFGGGDSFDSSFGGPSAPNYP